MQASLVRRATRYKRITIGAASASRRRAARPGRCDGECRSSSDQLRQWVPRGNYTITLAALHRADANRNRSTTTDPGCSSSRAFPGASDGCAHCGNGLGVIAAAEDRRASDKPVRTRPGDGADVIDLDATVDLETDFPARARDHGVDALARERELVQCLVVERLSRKARVHRHDQDGVDIVQ